MSRSEWSNAKKGKGKGKHKSSKERRTPLFECEDEDGNNYILNINWNQGGDTRQEILNKLEKKRKDFENQAAAAKAIENGMKIRKKKEKK